MQEAARRPVPEPARRPRRGAGSAPPDTSAWHAATRRTWRSWRAAHSSNAHFCSPWWTAGRPNPGRPVAGVDEIGDAGGTELRHEPHGRGIAAAIRSMSRTSPWYQPKYRWLSVPSSSGSGGGAECGTTSRDRIGARSSASPTGRAPSCSTMAAVGGHVPEVARTWRRPRCRTPPRSVRCGRSARRRVVAELVSPPGPGRPPAS